MNCDVCEKPLSLTTPQGEITCVGVSLQFTIPDNATDQEVEFYQGLVGVYKLGQLYNVCSECWLKSLGVKP